MPPASEGRRYKRMTAMEGTIYRALRREDPAWLRIRESVKFAAGGGLLRADAAGGDVGLEVVFTFDGGVGEAAELGDLADVIEGVSDRALEESLSLTPSITSARSPCSAASPTPPSKVKTTSSPTSPPAASALSNPPPAANLTDSLIHNQTVAQL